MRRSATATGLSVTGALTCIALVAGSAGAHTKSFKTNVNVVWGPVITYQSDAEDPYGGRYVEGASGTVSSKLGSCKKGRFVSIDRVPVQYDVDPAEDRTDAAGNFVMRLLTGPPPFYSGWPTS